MTIITPEIEYVDRALDSIRYLEHGWPNDLCRWHSHEEYEIHLITETRGRAFVGDYIGDFKPGSLFLTGPDLPHNWITDEVIHQNPVAVRDMLIQFSHDSVEHMCKAFHEFKEMGAMFDLARSGIEFVGFDPNVALRHLEAIRGAKGAARVASFLSFLVDINNHSQKRPLSVAHVLKPEGNSKQTRVAEVVDYITLNFAEEFSLDTAANMAGMSTTSFSRNFQKGTGKKFVEFVNQVRIAQACAMLYATEEQVSAICFEVGFQNLANFNRHFLKMKNMTPTSYRELARGKLTREKRVAV